jgi:hypothetical protein
MKRIVRDRLLTPEEVAEDRRIRDLIEEEKSEIIAEFRERAAAVDLGDVHAVSPIGAELDAEVGGAPRRNRADGQKTGLAGEFFVAAELLKRGFQTSVTFGNAKAIDLVAVHPVTRRVFTIQVKALRSRNFFPLDHSRVERGQVYVFAILNKPGEAVQYFIVPGVILADDPERFGKYFRDPKFPGINWSQLHDFADRWTVFDEVS